MVLLGQAGVPVPVATETAGIRAGHLGDSRDRECADPVEFLLTDHAQLIDDLGGDAAREPEPVYVVRDQVGAAHRWAWVHHAPFIGRSPAVQEPFEGGYIPTGWRGYTICRMQTSTSTQEAIQLQQALTEALARLGQLLCGDRATQEIPLDLLVPLTEALHECLRLSLRTSDDHLSARRTLDRLDVMLTTATISRREIM